MEVISVVVIVVIDVQLVGVVPVVRPIFRPRVHEQERIPAIGEPGIAQVHGGAVLHAERVLVPKGEREGVLRNVVAAVAAALRPSAVIAGPILCTILLERSVSLPAASLRPALLLLPVGCLLPGALGLLLYALRLLLLLVLPLLGLLRRLLLLRLLRPLALLLLPALFLLPLLRLLVLSPLLLRLLNRLPALLLFLLLLRWLRLAVRALLFLLLVLLPLGFPAVLVLVVRLRKRRNRHSEEHNQRSGADTSNYSHNQFSVSSLLVLHAEHQPAPLSGISYRVGRQSGRSACAAPNDLLWVAMHVPIRNTTGSETWPMLSR